MRKALITLLAMAMILMSCTTAFAQTYSNCWAQDAEGNWIVKDKTGAPVKNTWFCDDAATGTEKNAWYLLDENGRMVTGGLIQDAEGNYYSLETEHNGYFGMMRYASGNYEGVDIVINENHDGFFGRITDEASIARLTAKYGVKNVNIPSSKVTYASSIKAYAVKSSSSSRSSGSSKKKSSNCFTKDGTYEAGQATIIVSENATKVEYLNLDDAGQDYTIETKSNQNLIINAPNDNVIHKGSAKSVTINAIAGESYHGQAAVDSMTIKAGHVELEKNVGELVIAADKDVALDIAKKTKVPTIDVSKNEEDGTGAEILIVDGGTVNKITSSTGDINLEITETATKKPRLEFVGAEAVKAYRKRCEEKLQDGITASIRCGDVEITHKTTKDERFWYVDSNLLAENGIDNATFNDEVYIDGDFTQIYFDNCTFKKNIYNNGNEMCMVMFGGCTFNAGVSCKFDNTGRTLESVNDLISKFVWVGDVADGVNVVCPEGTSGAVIVTDVKAPAKLNGKKYSYNDLQYYVDETVEGAIVEYDNYDVNILYVGQFNILNQETDETEKHIMILGEYDPGNHAPEEYAKVLYPREFIPESEEDIRKPAYTQE